jgi:GNAT superfamily N-acetyltransferase
MQIVRLGADDERPNFDCGDNDLNEYFEKDSRQGCLELIAVTYAVFKGDELVAFFSVSNDSLKKEEVGNSPFRRVVSDVPRPKRYSSQPAVKIGRFAVAKDWQSNGLGKSILDYLKAWFTIGNKIGCRFMIVDAYRQAIPFYQKNGFAFLSHGDETEQTRLMYFDLITVARIFSENLSNSN